MILDLEHSMQDSLLVPLPGLQAASRLDRSLSVYMKDRVVEREIHHHPLKIQNTASLFV